LNDILLIGYKNTDNFGDPIILECVEKLLFDNSIQNIDVLSFDKTTKKRFKFIIGKLFSFSARYLTGKYKSRFEYISQWFFHSDIFKGKIKATNHILFVGGGIIKFNRQSFDYKIRIIINYAYRLNKKISFNSVGIEGYDEKNYRCLKLKKAINRKNVRHFSTRDNLVDMNNYITPNFCGTSLLTPDSAFLSNELYPLPFKSNNGIGIGVIRSDIFTDEEIPLSSMEVKKIYNDIIDTLLKKKIKFSLFTNGYKKDNSFLIELINQYKDLGIDIEYFIPKSSKHLIEIIYGYSKIISARMHSIIIAYSCNVPFLAIVWNKKITYMLNIIKENDLIVDIENFNALETVTKLLSIKFKENYNNNINEIKTQIYHDFQHYIIN
jgi:polysaccharide pyruvyl transferase WcaK-like protein